MAIKDDLAVYSAMQEGKPFKRYIKTILAQVHVTTINPFTGEPESLILSGDPSKEDIEETCYVEIWDNKQDQFFQRMNKNHFQAGVIKEYKAKEVKREPSVNEISDEEIQEILNKPFLALRNKLNSFTSPAPVYRFLSFAEKMEKSEKILDAIRERASELEFPVPEDEEEE